MTIMKTLVALGGATRVAQDNAAHFLYSDETVSSVGKVCRISESEDGVDGIYHIGFTFNVLGCSNMRNCNFFHMKTLAKHFIEAPNRIPPTGPIGDCKCKLKLIGGSTEEKTLLSFISTVSEPCEEYMCWSKYNQFVYLSRRAVGMQRDGGSNFRNASAIGNHWNIACEEGKADISSLKTIRELRNEAPEPVRKDMIGHAAEAGILPESSTDLTQILQQFPEDTIVHAINSMDGVEDFQSSNAPGPVVDKLGADGLQTAEDLPKAFTDDLYQAAHLMQTIEEKLAGMLLESESFTKLAHKMSMGKTGEALDGDWESCQVLAQNLGVLVHIAGYNVNNLQAFKAAVQMTNIPAAALEEFLLATKDALTLQFEVRRALERLVASTADALGAFHKHDGASAEEFGDHIMEQLGLLKREVHTSRVHLQKAIEQISTA